MRREVRVRYEAVSDRHAVVSVVSVDYRVAEHAAVCLSAYASEVSVIVSCRRSDEGDVDVALTGSNRSYAPSVRTHYGQAFQLARGDCLPDAPSYSRRFDVGDGAVFYHRHECAVRLAERGRAYPYVLETHLVDLFHYHVHYQVAFAEVMVERDGHAVVSLALLERVPDIRNKFGFLIVHYRTNGRSVKLDRLVVAVEIALKRLLPGKLEYFVRDFSSYCVYHPTDPPYIRLMPWPELSFSLLRRRTRCLSFCRPR